ncbi:phenylacetate--CoA ligase family protein [Arthrobacter oryzae]|uniref:Phenylacetate-coenzyme A ligase PaaK-like adenylate-forming protein n=1 Tax=Arthrobacter oryzae TaxID=409290 RepID=A0A495EQS2_9MICC|nr:phenylacetate--CoA ligase family protein [Arthrobacter oryzae]RKR19340.1 phenylacetate-coenzyme A ligase PaaK-like adenylate-forming protein [Arthrobacter oryzae]
MTRLTGIAWDIWRAERASQEAIARRQHERLAGLVEYARSASPFYRRLYRDVPETLTDLRELPPVGKRELMENFDDWVTDPHITLAGLKEELLGDPSRIGGFYRGHYLVMTTSGTTGEPAVLVQDRNTWLVANLLARIRERRTLVTAKEARAFLRRGLRAAALIADGDHFAGVVLTENARRRSPHIARRVRVFSVLRRLPDLVAELNDFQPTMLYGYPSAMLQLAAEQKSGRLRIRPVLAIASGEGLTAKGAADIEAALGCRATERYLASEALALTSRCRAGLFHVNADWYIVEPVDRNFQPVPAGELSHTVLVTNLANRVQPLIRYNLGDRVQPVPGPCACGSVFPALRVEGRSGDVLMFAGAAAADRTTVPVTVLPLALGTVIEETAGVRRFQAIRTGPRSLTVRLELWPEATTAAVRAAVGERLGAFFAAQGADGVDVRFADEPPRPDRSGKFREVWSA